MPLIDSFKRHLEKRLFSRRSIAAYSHVVSLLIQKSDRPPTAETVHDDIQSFLDQWAARAIGHDICMSTIRPALIELARFLGCGRLPTIPSAPRRDPVTHRQPLCEMQVGRCVDSLSEPWQTIALLISKAGLTTGDVLRLRTSDVMIRARTIRVRAQTRRGERSIPLPGCLCARLALALRDRARRHAEDCLKGHGWISIEDRKGAPRITREFADQFLFDSRVLTSMTPDLRYGRAHLSSVSFEAELRSVSGLVPIADCVTATDLRRAAIVHWLRMGAPEPVIRKRLGFVRRKSIEPYLADVKAQASTEPQEVLNLNALVARTTGMSVAVRGT